MRSLMAVVLAALLSPTGLTADREDLEKQWEKRRAEAAERQKEYKAKHGWRALTYSLPGGYRFLDRLELTDPQKKVLGEVHAEWTAKRAAAWKDIAGQLPKLTPRDYADPDKRKAYYDKRNELIEKKKVGPPVEQVKTVLTIEQLDKLEAANQIIVAWSKWVVEKVPAYQQRLADAVGPAPEKGTAADRYMLSRLEPALPGAALLGRLDLPDDTLSELRKVAGWGFAPEPAARRRAALELLKGQKVPPRCAMTVYQAVMNGKADRRQVKARGAVEKLLTADQIKRLAKGAEIVKERDEAVATKYAECVAKLDKALPPRAPAYAAVPKVTAPQPPKAGAEIIAAWNKWLTKELPKFDRKLDAELGPNPEGLTRAESYQYQHLTRLLKGARLLARLGLAEQQLADLKKLGRTAYHRSYEERAAFGRLVDKDKIDEAVEQAVEDALENTRTERRKRSVRAAIKEVLTLEQSAKFERGLKILEERDAAIRQQYSRTLSALEAALPPPKDKANNKPGAPRPWPRRGQGGQ